MRTRNCCINKRGCCSFVEYVVLYFLSSKFSFKSVPSSVSLINVYSKYFFIKDKKREDIWEIRL